MSQCTVGIELLIAIQTTQMPRYGTKIWHHLRIVAGNMSITRYLLAVVVSTFHIVLAAERAWRPCEGIEGSNRSSCIER